MSKSSYIVYIHRFPNGKVYVGITSLKPYERWCGGHGYDGQPLMRRAIKKYGWENVKHSVISSGLTKEDAESEEIRLIKYYNSNNRAFGYNIDNGGSSRGRMSEGTKERLRASHLGCLNPQYGKPLTEDHKNKIRETRKKLDYQPVNKQKIMCVETGIIYDSTAAATRHTGISNSLIRRVCYGEKKSAGGFHWKYVN